MARSRIWARSAWVIDPAQTCTGFVTCIGGGANLFIYLFFFIKSPFGGGGSNGGSGAGKKEEEKNTVSPFCRHQKKTNLGATIRIGQESRCLPYAGFFLYRGISLNFMKSYICFGLS